VVDEHMHTSTLNVYSAGDVALAYNVIARRRIPAEHWCDAAQQGLVAGLSAAGHQAACNKAPEFSCTMGESTLNADDDYRRADQLVRSHADDDIANHSTPRGSVRSGSQMLSTRETNAPGTTIQLTDARELKASIVCRIEKPAVAKKVTSLRSRIKLRQFAPLRST